MLRNKTFLRIFSLLAAIFLWFYVMGEVDPETREMMRDIPVTFINTDVLAEKGLAVAQEEEVFITALVEGKRSDVNDVKKTGLTAYVDVAQCSKGKNKEKINVVTPDSVSLESLSMNSVKVKVEALTEAQKPIEIELTDTVSGTDKMVRVLEMEQDSVSVSGAGSSVESITAFKGVVSANEASEEESRWVDVSLTPVAEDDKQVLGVNAETDKIKVRIQLLSIKTVELTVTTKNAEDGLELAELNVPKRVQIIGPVYFVEGLEAVSGTVDLTGVTGKAEREVALALPEDTFILEENNKPVAEVTMKATE